MTLLKCVSDRVEVFDSAGNTRKGEPEHDRKEGSGRESVCVREKERVGFISVNRI